MAGPALGYISLISSLCFLLLHFPLSTVFVFSFCYICQTTGEQEIGEPYYDRPAPCQSGISYAYFEKPTATVQAAYSGVTNKDNTHCQQVHPDIVLQLKWG